MDRVYNVEKSRKRTGPDIEDSTPKKRGRPKKRSSNLKYRYPLIQSNGVCDASEQQNVEAMSMEMEKNKPRKDILLPLMKSTFMRDVIIFWTMMIAYSLNSKSILL